MSKQITFTLCYLILSVSMIYSALIISHTPIKYVEIFEYNQATGATGICGTPFLYGNDNPPIQQRHP
jgi:hypothetical protein